MMFGRDAHDNELLNGLLELLKKELAPRLQARGAICGGLIGSVAEGLNTLTSDVDAIALVPGLTEQRFEQTVIADTVVDVWFVGLDYFQALMQSVGSPQSFRNANIRGLELTHKAFSAKAFLGEEFYADQVKEFDWASFRNNLARMYLRWSKNMFTDFVGASSSCGYVGQTSFGRQYAQIMADALLVLAGDTYIKQKWRMVRCQRLTGQWQELASHYLQIELSQPDPSEILRWTASCFAFGAAVQTLILEALGHTKPQCPWEMPDGRRLVRSAACLIQEQGDQLLLYTPKKVFSIPREAAGNFMRLASSPLLTLQSLSLREGPAAMAKMALASQYEGTPIASLCRHGLIDVETSAIAGSAA